MLIAGFFAISAQFGLSAYDAVGLKTEINQIKDFSEKIVKLSTTQATTVSAWLDQVVSRTNGYWCNGSYQDGDMTVLDIVRIINGPGNDDYKIMSLLVMVEAEKAAQAEHKLTTIKEQAERDKRCEADRKLWARNENIRKCKIVGTFLVGLPLLFTSLITTEFFVRNALANWKNAPVVAQAVVNAVS